MRTEEVIFILYIYIYTELYFKNWRCRDNYAHFIANVPRQTSLSLRENRANEKRRSVKGSFGRTNAHSVLFRGGILRGGISPCCAQVAARNLTLISVIPPEK